MSLRPTAGFLLILLSGCGPVSTTAGYERILNSWMGASGDSLVRSWGPPTSTFRMASGNTLLIYNNSRSTIYTEPTQVTPGQTTGYWIGNNYYSTTTPSTVTGGQTYNLTFRCQTQFEIEPSGRIVHWRYEGNACKAVDPNGK
jgi:hypothetical protein